MRSTIQMTVTTDRLEMTAVRSYLERALGPLRDRDPDLEVTMASGAREVVLKRRSGLLVAGETEYRFTAAQANLLHYLGTQPRVWGAVELSDVLRIPHDHDTAGLRTAVRRVRNVLGDLDLIETLRNVGYRWNDHYTMKEM